MLKFNNLKHIKFWVKGDIMKIVEEAMSSLSMGLIAYESSGKKIKCYTSDKMKAALDKLVKGDKGYRSKHSWRGYNNLR